MLEFNGTDVYHSLNTNFRDSSWLPPDFDHIPLALRSQGNFCLWRYERKRDPLKPKHPKVPYVYDRHTTIQAKVNFPNDWMSFEAARTAYLQF